MPAKHTAAYRRKYWRDNPEKSEVQNERTKLYQKTLYGRMAHRAGSINTQAKNRGCYGKLTKDDLLELWKSHGGINKGNEVINDAQCNICHDQFDLFGERSYIIDHILPIAYGGENSVENIQFLCPSCDKEKTNKDSRARSRYSEYGTLPEYQGGTFKKSQLLLFGG